MSTALSDTTSTLQARSVFTISELTSALRQLVESHHDDVWVEGEISNFTRAASGHCYFTLKDADAQLSCVMWRSTAGRLSFRPEDGLQVQVQGGVSIYEKRGDLQIKVDRMRPAGDGALREAFEALKRQLDGEGLFDDGHKKPLPPFPQTVGIVTSDTGAALHDMCSTLQRRFPPVEVTLCPVHVQGDLAAGQIADAIRLLDGHDTPPDVLIIGRGGGSIEDLWAFNEEVVARAIHAAATPIVSAVGHETDFTIADYVADRRAATPTMAAELVVPERTELLAQLDNIETQLVATLRSCLSDHQQQLDYLTRSHGFRRTPGRIQQKKQDVRRLADQMRRQLSQQLTNKKQRFRSLRERLTLLDPRRPLDRGYVKVEHDGVSVARGAALARDDRIQLHFQDGSRTARIEE